MKLGLTIAIAAACGFLSVAAAQAGTDMPKTGRSAMIVHHGHHHPAVVIHRHHHPHPMMHHHHPHM